MELIGVIKLIEYIFKLVFLDIGYFEFKLVCLNIRHFEYFKPQFLKIANRREFGILNILN